MSSFCGRKGYVRNNDPVESRQAINSVNVKKDRRLMYQGFVSLARAVTMRAAAEQAVTLEGTQGNPRRLESLRRRGHDLLDSDKLGCPPLIEVKGTKGKEGRLYGLVGS